MCHVLEQPPSDDFYNYIDSTKIENPSASPELEYTYSKDTDVPKNPPQTKIAPQKPAVYHTLKQPPSDDFYTYIDSTEIENSSASPELEYTYSKDTDIPKLNPQQTKIAAKAPAVYETLENPSSDDVYYYIDNTNVAKPATSEQEYSYARDTNLPRAGKNEKREPTAKDAVYHTLEQEQPLPSSSKIPTELEYLHAKTTDLPRKPATTDDENSYAKDTEMPSMDVEQTNTGSCEPPTNNGLYHTLEESNPPQVPLYSTLEEVDAETAQVNKNI